MATPNWRNPDDYGFATMLSREQWAWEFLRRNPEYQRDWRQFWSAWQALEQEYGAPPNRDFQAWQRDPRAYREVGRDADAGDCRVDEDRVLIECALGAKWGFYKFPLDPAVDRPVIGEQLSWRELPQGVVRLSDDDETYLGGNPAHIGLGFDLDLPLREQLDRARQFLVATQRGRVRDGLVQMRTVTARWPDWQRYLRCLDALVAGATREEVGRVLGRSASQLEADYVRALQLREGAYRELPGLPES